MKREIDVYEAKPIVDSPILDSMDPACIIAWFRCNSCYTCRFKDVLDAYGKTIMWCGRTHERCNIVDMVEFLGYSKE